MNTRKVTSLCAIALAVGGTLTAPMVLADTKDSSSTDQVIGSKSGEAPQKVIDESYVQPDYVLGWTLNTKQKEEVLKIFSFDESKDKYKTLDSKSYTDVMKETYIKDRQLYSSVKIQALSKDQPLEVTILTPKNITKVTTDMYRNAALTVGIEHAKIEVASPIAVSGESALAGVYYSMKENGAKLDKDRVDLSNQEVGMLKEINEENKDDKDFDPSVLNVALMDIKKSIAELDAKQMNEDNIKKIVEGVLDNYKIAGVVTPNQATQLVNYGVAFSKTSAVTDSEFVKSLTSVKDDIVSKSTDAFKGLNIDFDADETLKEAKGFFGKVWDVIKRIGQSIAGFFIWLVDMIKSLF